MELSIRVEEHDRLESLSFTEVYRVFAELMRRHWEQQQIERHIRRRARRCCRKRRLHADCAAVLSVGDLEATIDSCDTAG